MSPIRLYWTGKTELFKIHDIFLLPERATLHANSVDGPWSPKCPGTSILRVLAFSVSSPPNPGKYVKIK